MLCERCNKKKATLVYRENLSGNIRSLRLCGECTDILEAAGELEELGTVLSPFASPLLFADEGEAPPFFPEGNAPTDNAEGLRCPLCGSTLGELSAEGRVGCARCYETFVGPLGEIIRTVHGKAIHAGRIAAGARGRRERIERLARLRLDLKSAIIAEQYESAAALRDEIRVLEAEAQ